MVVSQFAAWKTSKIPNLILLHLHIKVSTHDSKTTSGRKMSNFLSQKGASHRQKIGLTRFIPPFLTEKTVRILKTVQNHRKKICGSLQSITVPPVGWLETAQHNLRSFKFPSTTVGLKRSNYQVTTIYF